MAEAKRKGTAEGKRTGKSRSGMGIVIPDKLYFRIGEVARLLDLPPYVLRFWETEFPQLHPNKGGTGQRLYRRRDVEAAVEIRRLLYDEGYTIPGARQALRSERPRETAATANPAPPVVKESPAPAKGSDGSATGSAALRLRKLRSDLQEVAAMLEQPAPGQRRARPTHRGLTLASRRTGATQDLPLFRMPSPDES